MQYLAILATILLQVFCVVHALRRGYPTQFVIIILVFPVIGSLAYLTIEIGPDIYHRFLRRSINNLRPKQNPFQELAQLQNQVKNHPTAENQHRLSKMYQQIGHFNESIFLLDNLLQQKAFSSDPYLLLDKANAHFALNDFQSTKQILDVLKSENPTFQSPTGDLLYARTLSELGFIEEANLAFEVLERHFHGLESSYYFLQHLRKLNDHPRAKEVLQNMQNRFQRLPQHYRHAQQAWLKQAQREH
ncbi:MAG: hypothetical protein HYX61_10955 [Gammaproteobacteria bacterium]|nr:hypothetical protein [Gammaproteobacteria bacterium]